MSDAFLPNEDPYQNIKTRIYDNWRTISAVLSQEKIIQNVTLQKIAIEEIFVKKMVKRVAAEDNARDQPPAPLCGAGGASACAGGNGGGWGVSPPYLAPQAKY